MDSNENTENEIIIPEKKIPLNIYQTWMDKNLEPGMISAIIKLKKNNPEFNYYFFDDKNCRDFIIKYFPIEVLDAYDRLIPGAYKADLWRYCILYIHGGIYLDIKYEPVEDFKFIHFVDKEYFVKDRDGHWIDNQIGIYNAFMITYPKNEILLKCINQIVKNVSDFFYGHNSLYPTGPGLLGSYFDPLTEFDFTFSDCAKYILYKNEKVLQVYDKYRAEQLKYQSKTHYTFLWRTKKIYVINKELNKKIKLAKLISLNPVIPLNIYQIKFNETTINLKNNENLECFNCYNFSLNDCSMYLKNAYGFKYFSIFNKIRNLKLKIDLWKYSFLYKNGGIYIDTCLDIDFDKINIITLLLNENCLVNKELKIFKNSLIFTPKKNKKFLELSEYIIKNYIEIESKYDDIQDSLFSEKFSIEDILLFNLSISENKLFYNHIEIGKINI